MAAKQRKRSDVIDEFESLRDRTNGEVALAAPLMGMTPEALDRALWRARKAGWTGGFTCLPNPRRKNAAPAEAIHFHEQPLPPRYPIHETAQQ